jgi:hypothetical protein
LVLIWVRPHVLDPESALHSIPSDLGTFMMVDYIKQQLGKKTAKVKYAPE